jgi:hypothetical protein
LTGNVNTWGATPSNRPDIEEIDAQWSTADPGFIELLGVQLLAGRTITTADRANVPSVAVINKTLAERLWPGEPLHAVVGRQLRTFDHTTTVIGVVANGKYSTLHEDPRSFGFFPMAQRSFGVTMLYVRGAGPMADAIQAVREEIQAIDANVALEPPTMLVDDIERYLIPQRLGSVLVGGFGVIGLVLAAMGLYGVLAYGVAQRMREFGIRMALGARGRDVMSLVLRRGLQVVGVGLALGILGAMAAGQLVESFLFGFSPVDPVVLSIVPLILVAVSLAASLIPARRAATADPMSSLRAE